MRPASAADALAVYFLYKALFQEHIEKIWGWDETWQQGNFAEEWQVAETRCAYSGSRLAGYVQLKREPDHLYLLSVALGPDFQGRGIGRRIMLGFQEEAAHAGLPLRLSVFRTNLRALAFYKSLDFRVTAETEEFHRLEWCPAGWNCPRPDQ